MDDLKMERFANRVWESVGDLVTDNSKTYEDIYKLIEDAIPDEKAKNEFYMLNSALIIEMFNVGFFQGVAWSKGVGIV